MSRSKIVNRLGGKTLEELVSPEFLDRFGLDTPAQYGMVCGDVEAEINQL